MPVTLTSPVLGLDVGAVYTGDEEEYLLAQGYARRDGYTGPGVSNTGLAAQTPAEDLTLAENREPAPTRDEQGREDSGQRDPAMTFAGDTGANDGEEFDFDEGGVNDDAPTIDEFSRTGLPLAGGQVTLYGQNFEGTTGVTVGGTAATGVTVEADNKLVATFPAMAAGTYDVAVTNATGTTTKTGAVTYAA